MKLSFRGFEIKTVKLTVEKSNTKKKVGSGSTGSSSAVVNDGWIKL